MLPSHLRPSGLAVTVAATVALGVAMVTAGFGVADAALWRGPPFPRSSEVAILVTTRRSATTPLHPERWSYPRISRLRATLRSVPRIANFTPTTVSLTGTDQAELLAGEVVSPEYFTVLGVAPALGRGFGAGDDGAPGRSPVALVGDELWRRRFGGDAAVVGRTIELNRRALTVIGVMPPGFRGLSDAAQVWIPTAMAPLISYDEYLTTNQNFINLVTRADRSVRPRLAAELAALMPGVAREFPSDDDDASSVVSATVVPLSAARVPPDLRRGPWLLLAAVAVLHLLACANAASLLLGRAVARRRDAAIRASLGETTGALFRRAFRESAAPVAFGAIAGLAAAWLAGRLAVPINAWGARNSYGSIGTFADPRFGSRNLFAWLALSVATVVLVAWAPALATVRGDLTRHLREGGQAAGAAGLSLRRLSARGVIVAVEMALAVVLLVVGGLMIESLARIRETPLGVEPDRVLTFTLRPSEVDVPTRDAPAFIQRMLDAIAAVPGVEAASVDGGAPLSGSATSTLRIVGRPAPGPGAEVVVRRHYVGPDHFRALGVPVSRGRGFSEQDRAGAPRVTVISESAARRFWPGEDPIGRRVWFGAGNGFGHPDSSSEIIGVVGDVTYQPLDRAPNAASFYTPFRQFTYAWRTYFVRTAGDPVTLVRAVRAAVGAVDPNVPMAEVMPLRDLIGASWSRNRFDAYFYGGFAAVALVLAATGVYSVLAYAVRRRDREMAIRLAVGASPAAVFRLVVGEGMGLPLAGLAVGGLLTAVVLRLVRGSVYGLASGSPWVPLLAGLVLVAVATLACAVPALRAMRTEPQTALRTD